MAAEELGLLLKGNRFHGDQTDMIPNRSGSAPPSMEGSFAAIGNLLGRFPYTTSPVYNQSCFSGYSMTDEPTDHDVHAVTLDVSAINLSEVQGQTASPGMNHIQSGMEKHSHGHAKFSSIEPSGVYAPHYNVGGYALNFAFLLPFVAGYPPHGLNPMPFDATSGPCYSIQTTGVRTAESIPHMGDLQYQKFYGHHVDSSIQEEPPSAAYLGDQKLLSPPHGSLGIPNPRKLGISIDDYYGGLQAWVSLLNFQYRLFLVRCCHHYQLVEQVIQFFKRGSPGQRKELEDKLVGQMLPLSLQMYGCHVIQKVG
ncbi:hypothetical protein Patl1_35219 [Pistacia atlantica]|uniref:Uncharacterized protein n=1 Tax=Pistacia atlantica TaxID=434234 RepID=A0ACC0ZTQ6_9ROSI|nr:hypothetical protein Patl1_35219 [Pistacia atlantica]